MFGRRFCIQPSFRIYEQRIFNIGRCRFLSSGKEPKRGKQEVDEKGRENKKELDAIQKFIELSEAAKRLT